MLDKVAFSLRCFDLFIGLAVGCHWKSGMVCYADDLTLLEPSPAALWLMLNFCEVFASSHGLKFNSSKTQLIRFGFSKSSTSLDLFLFCGALPLLDSLI